MRKDSNILLAFYGDDLTGSTDALEFISRAGAKAVLFLEPPTQEQLNAFPDLQAYGIAGLTRSLSPEKMKAVLLPAFKAMKESGAKHIHYKVCSTFDSSPEIGSIGTAIDCGAEVFQNKLIPVLGGMPALGRYCVFGNLFARMGIGSNGKIYRLDRHPSMSKHPVTPSHESDLRLHLAAQTNKKIGLIDIVQMEKDIDDWGVVEDDEIVLLDALTEEQLGKIGKWLDEQQKSAGCLFSVGSSGIEMALGKHWQREQILQLVNTWSKVAEVKPHLVVSGSCSPVTGSQIAHAKQNGFNEVIIEIATYNARRAEKIIHDVVKLLLQQKDVIVHTGKKEDTNLSSEIVGNVLGTIAKEAIKKTGIKRVVVAGGDTSSYVGRAMEVDALEMIVPFVSGAPLCKVHSKNKSVDGIEINLKGGQVGSDDYFVALKDFKINNRSAEKFAQ